MTDTTTTTTTIIVIIIIFITIMIICLIIMARPQTKKLKFGVRVKHVLRRRGCLFLAHRTVCLVQRFHNSESTHLLKVGTTQTHPTPTNQI